MRFSNLNIGGAFTSNGIQYRKTSEITGESAFSIALFDGADDVSAELPYSRIRQEYAPAAVSAR